jgi:hypothetical protein
MKRRMCVVTWIVGWMTVALGVAAGPIAAEETSSVEGARAAEPAPEVKQAPAPKEASGGVPSVFAELLFLKPTLDGTYFVIRSPASSALPNGQRTSNGYDYQPAFRIGAGYAFADTGRSLELSYTRLETDASKSVAGDFLWATVGHPDFARFFSPYAGTASAHTDARYQRIDAHVTQPWQFAGMEIGLQFGAEWADLRVGESYAFASSIETGTVSAASRSWGIGPEVGLGLDWEICHSCGIPGAFTVKAGSSIGVLLSETNARAGNTLSGAPLLAVRDQQTSRVLPAIHARVGLGYAFALAERIGLTAGAGYQIDSYPRALERLTFVDDFAVSLVTTNYYDFDAQGVYASLGVVF